MAVPRTLDFNTLPAASPATPPASYTKPAGSDNAAIIQLSVKEFALSGAACATWYDNTNLTGTWISSEIKCGTTNGSGIAPSLVDASGNGWMATTSDAVNNVRIFLMVAGQLSGSALYTIAQTHLVDNLVKLRRNTVTGEMQIWVNGAQIGVSYFSSTYNPTFAGATSRGGKIRSLTSEYTPPVSIDTLTNPLIPNTTFNGTCSAFTDGSAVLSFGGVSVPVTIASGIFSGTIPMIADNIAWPKLPALLQTITLTQGANTASILVNISLPNNYDSIKDSTNTLSNFFSIVTDNNEYLGYWFSVAGNALTTNDTCVFFTGGNYKVYTDSGVSADSNNVTYPLPRTETIYIYRGATGKYYEHIVVLNALGIVEVIPSIPISLVDNNGRSRSGYPIIASYKFSIDSLYSQVKNGFIWAGSKTIGTPAGETESGGTFTFTGNPDPRNQPVVEQRYAFNEMNEFWLKKRFFVPTNYFHRRCSTLIVTGDLSTWQRGDNLLANNGIDTAKVEYISGSTVMILFPTGDYDLPWDGVVTNVTRSQTYPCDRTGIWQDNNKFHALWCDDYSYHGASPTIVFELHASDDGGSKIYYHFGADFVAVGVSLPNSTSASVPFIRPIDFGKWFDCIFHVKMATSETAANGIIEFWLRREDESNYTKLFSQSNCMIGPRAAASNAKFRNGYCHGAANTGFYSTTSFYDSEIILSASTIDGVL